jgi:uncharacterized protein YciI
MKTLLFLFFLFLGIQNGISQDASTQYDKALADSLGADEYGMKSYVLVILKSGPNQTTDQAILDGLFRGHMNNIQHMARLKKLVVAGPMGDNERNYRGIFILSVDSMEEAAELVNADPAVKEKLFDAEFYAWYGSAALPAYLKVHEQIEKQKP